MNFIDHVEEQSKKMSEKEKTEWILTRAKLMPESERESFLRTLSGEDKVIGMPAAGIWTTGRRDITIPVRRRIFWIGYSGAAIS